MWSTKAILGLILSSAALWSPPAWGQDFSPVQTYDFTLSLQRSDGDEWVDLDSRDSQTYFNQARCLCDSRIRIVVRMASASRGKLAALAAPGANARLYVGTDCAGLNAINQPRCPNGLLDQMNGLTTLSSLGEWAVETTVSRLFSAGPAGCSGTSLANIWLWLDSAGRGYPDADIAGENAPHLTIHLDGTPPAAPHGIAVEGSHESLKVSWAPMGEAATDPAGYLVFCMHDQGLQVFPSGFYASQYMTGLMVCGLGAPALAATDPMVSAAGNTTATEVDAPQAFRDLDPNFLCSGLVPASQTGVLLRVLQNGVPYTVGVAAVDMNGNASPIRRAFVQAPQAGVDPMPDTAAFADAGVGATADAGADAGDEAGPDTAKLASSGCDCHLAQAGDSSSPLVIVLLLPLAQGLRRRARSKRR